MDVRYQARTGLTSRDKYEALYRESLDNPAAFWLKQAEGFAWRKKVRAHAAQRVHATGLVA